MTVIPCAPRARSHDVSRLRSWPGRRGAVGTRPSPRTTTISVVRPWLMHGQHHHRITTVALATGLLHGQDQPPQQPANLRDAQRDPRPRPALNAASGLASGGAAAFFTCLHRHRSRAQDSQECVAPHLARVRWRYQPVHLRTSSSSRPTSPLAASKLLSLVQRAPATRTTSSTVVAWGARTT
jgi:hypothetical protein